MLNDVISGQWTWCSSASDPQKFDDIYIKINYSYQSQKTDSSMILIGFFMEPV